VALSGWIDDTLTHKFGLSELVAATWTGIVKRKFIVLSGPSGILPHNLPYGLVLSKDNLLSCPILVERYHLTWQNWLCPRESLSPYLTKLALSEGTFVTLFDKIDFVRGNLCHPIWRNGFCPRESLPPSIGCYLVNPCHIVWQF